MSNRRREMEQATVLQALPRILAAIAREALRTTCPIDGCLVTPGEHCPACMARRPRRPPTTTAPATPAAPPPAGWVRKGSILVRKKAA